MLSLYFSGWFQCRLATDPDPTDEPRGVSGFTFAVAGEPDFDRIIRLRDPVAPRSHGPAVGVQVDRVAVDGRVEPGHPLVGARVDLLDQPRFESWNAILRKGSSGPIHPFHLELAQGDVRIRREDVLHPPDPSLPLHQIPPESVERRSAVVSMAMDHVRIADATGMADPLALRARRREQLVADREACGDPVARAALDKRIEELSIVAPHKMQLVTMNLYNDYRFALNGPSEVRDPRGRVGARLDRGAEWPILFWMGGWDSDALCGHIRGTLMIPTQAP
ncbi:MAG: hypothetical protein KDK70_01575 [Myxococcales bacterium]|nr:hypothetical protein [Myxococcales bacterium]